VEIEFRGHTVRVLDLKTLVELKRASTDPRDRQRLPVLEETLRQVEEEYGTEDGLRRTSYKDYGGDE
jgi:hypothetical protein